MNRHPSSLLSFSAEILEQILVHCHPRDVAAFSQTCRRAHAVVYGSSDQYLWREFFLSYPFDDPRRMHEGFSECPSFDWKGELQRRIRAEAIARSSQVSSEEQTNALETFLSVVRTASPVVRGYDRVPSPSLLWVVDILQSTNLLQSPIFNVHNGSQNLARLRSYLALTLDDYDEEDMERTNRMKALRGKSQCYVYDLSNYGRDNDWGPFTQLGEVNWVHIESIINVILSNQTELSPRFVDIRPPCGLEATRAYSAPGAATRGMRDWAGVEGSWRRYVSFMDYRCTFASNPYFNRSDFFETTRFEESTLLIELRLHLIERSAIPTDYPLSRFPGYDDSRYPTLYFAGSSVGIHGNEATVVGSVCMSHDGVVRWRFASAYDQIMQWSSEGVQVGGIASAAGVVGTWTGSRHEPSPFWLWKVTTDHGQRPLGLRV
ncbi:hypothetical protein V8B97DRAFT_2024941 [Scleroderma yunnanense]